MSFTHRASLIVALMALVGATATRASAQVFHLPPVYRPVLPKDDSVLTVTAVRDSSFDGGTIAIDDERLILTRKDGSTDIVTLGNREIRDVVNEIRSKYAGSLLVTTSYPLYSTRYLRSTRPRALSSTVTNILANPDEPELGLGFGAVLALGDTGPDDDTDQGLLSTTGFQLDLVGNLQARGPRPRKKVSGRPTDEVPYSMLIYVQPRLSLAANQQFQVSNQPAAGATSTTESQLQDAIAQADQIAVSLQTDFVFPLVANNLDFVTSPIFAISWSRLSDPGFPDIVVRDTIRSVETLFEPVLVTRARQNLRQTLPLAEYGLQGVFQFRRSQRPLFYVGGGYMQREITQPHVRFTRSAPNTDPDRLSLRASLETPTRTAWRAFFGARIAGVLDVRLDAAGPVGHRNSKPLLKVLLGRAFPTVRPSES